MRLNVLLTWLAIVALGVWTVNIYFKADTNGQIIDMLVHNRPVTN